MWGRLRAGVRAGLGRVRGLGVWSLEGSAAEAGGVRGGSTHLGVSGGVSELYGAETCFVAALEPAGLELFA